MKVTRKGITAVLAASLAGLILAACGGNQSDTTTTNNSTTATTRTSSEDTTQRRAPSHRRPLIWPQPSSRGRRRTGGCRIVRSGAGRGLGRNRLGQLEPLS